MICLTFNYRASAGDLITYADESSHEQMDSSTIRLRTGGYIAKNHRRTNYKVLTNWAFSYRHEVRIPYTGIYNTYKVYSRKVSYRATYDLYDKYSGNFIRRVSQDITSHESKMVLET